MKTFRAYGLRVELALSADTSATARVLPDILKIVSAHGSVRSGLRKHIRVRRRLWTSSRLKEKYDNVKMLTGKQQINPTEPVVNTRVDTMFAQQIRTAQSIIPLDKISSRE